MPLSWHKRRPWAHVTTIRSNAFLDEQSAKTPTGQQSGCPVQSTQQVLGECAPRISAPRLLPDLGPSRLLVPSAPATLSCVGLIPGPGKTFLQTQKSEFRTSFHMS